MIKLIFVLFILNYLIIAVLCIKNYEQVFIEYTNKYKKIYNNKEFITRYEIFKRNLDFIEKWNTKGSDTVLGLNYLADLSNEEYNEIYLGEPIDTSSIKKKKLIDNNFNKKYNFYSNDNIEDSVDWRLEFAVTKIKDQRTCAAGYAFSIIGSIESLNYIKNDELVVLSEQNIIDCVQGCKGGLPSISFDYIIRQKGIDSEFSYPYEGIAIEPYEGRGRCRYDSFYSSASIKSYVEIETNNENELINAISRSPVSVMIDASKLSFQLYSSGIYFDSTCSSTIVNHGMLVVGYSTSKDHKDYYIIKNSFSSMWGIKGYIHLKKNLNTCGISSLASYPVM